MTALAADRNTLSRDIKLKSYPVDGGSVIYKGALVCLNAAGYLVPAADTAGFLGTVGVADEKVDNSAGSDGDLNCRVQSGRAFKMVATSITQAMVGTVMYIVDDQTVDDAAGSTNEIPAGILIEYVSSTSGWVFIPEGGMSVDQPDLNVGTADIQAAAVTNAKLAAGGPGFVTGEGGAVTQITSAATAVTLNKRVGQITTVALTTAGAAEEAFVVNNSEVDANDIVVVTTTYAGGGKPIVFVTNVGAGVFTVNITNVSASALDAVLVVNFAVIKGVAA